MRFAVVLAVILLSCGAYSKNTEDKEAELWRLPKLYHLDDFEKCMTRKDGVFCLGIFEIYSDIENNPLYDLIQEKAQDVSLYNRSLLHRGYCLPTRCPSTEANVTARFESCVDTWARGHALRTRLRTLHYCRAHGQPPPVPGSNDTPHRVFLYVVYAILFMNAIGTLYDLINGKKKNKNEFLMMFSLRDNWLKFTAVQESGDAYQNGLKVLNGQKTILLVGAVYAHVALLMAQSWHHNPRFMEKFLNSPVGSMLGSLTTETQVFILISNFLTTYNLLLFSQKAKLRLRMVPILFLKRIARMLPVYLLVLGFSATWWTKMGDGPLWPLMVGSESQICRDKFWPQAFFLHNMFDSKRFCNIQTWIMAVDIQLYIPSLIITILLTNKKERAVPILYALLAGATALTGIVALMREYIPAFYYMTPEMFREMFINSRHFQQLFIMPINCIITMVFGILLGLMYYNAQQQEAKDEKKASKKLSIPMLVFHYLWCMLIFVWSYTCSTLVHITDPVFRALMVPVERLVYAFLGLVSVYTMGRKKSFVTSIFGWSGTRIIGRLSMSVSMVHWCVNKTFVANRYTLLDTSNGMMILDVIGVWVVSFIIAIPLALVVEYPMGKMMDKLLSYLFK